MAGERIEKFSQTYRIYLDRRMPQIFLLGLIQGFPWVLIGSALSLWLKEEGFSRSDIGLFGLVFSVYSVNFLWAPLMDRLRIPLLTRFFGQRRAWVLTMQLIIFGSMVGMFFVNPQAELFWVAFFAFLIALASATQDISLDALRIDLIGKSESVKLTGAAALMVAGWWTAAKLGGAAALYLAGYYQQLGLADSWQLVYVTLTAFVILGNILLAVMVRDSLDKTRFAAQSSYDEKYRALLIDKGIAHQRLNKMLTWLLGTIVAPLASFFRNNGVWIGISILGFIMLFKMGEAFLGRMSILFYTEIGFSKEEIAQYSKILGWVTTLFFSLAGGLINARFGLLRSIFISGIAMAATNLLFALMAFTGPEPWVFITAVVMDDFTSAVSTVTFVAFISQLCDRTFTATQYALMASLGTFARNTIASFSGFAVDGIEKWVLAHNLTFVGAGAENTAWALFFLLTTLMVIPSLLLLWFIAKRLGEIFYQANTRVL